MWILMIIGVFVIFGSCTAEKNVPTTQSERLAALEEITEQQRKEISVLQQEIRQLKEHNKGSEKFSTNNEQQKSDMRRFLVTETVPTNRTRPEVAFFSEKTKPLSNIGNHQPVVFEEVKVNQGGAYNGADGEFIAPIPGIYVFSWTTSNYPHSHMTTEMVVNGQRYAHTWSDANDHEDVSVASVTCVAQLKQNDRVWIRSGENHSGTLSCNGYSMCSFTGFLLY